MVYMSFVGGKYSFLLNLLRIEEPETKENSRERHSKPNPNPNNETEHSHSHSLFGHFRFYRTFIDYSSQPKKGLSFFLFTFFSKGGIRWPKLGSLILIQR